MLRSIEVAVPGDSTRVARSIDWEKLPVSVAGVKLTGPTDAIMLTWWLTLRTATLLSSPITVQPMEPSRLIVGVIEDEMGVGIGGMGIATVTLPFIHG
jgi:hypothetical protein